MHQVFQALLPWRCLSWRLAHRAVLSLSLVLALSALGAVNAANAAEPGLIGLDEAHSITTDNQAVFGGKYSPLTAESVLEAHRLQATLVSAWSSADPITDDDLVPVK